VENAGLENAGPENAGPKTCAENAALMSVVSERNVLIEKTVDGVMRRCSHSHYCFVTSAEEVGYVFTLVCLSVCLFVHRITEKVVNGF